MSKTKTWLLCALLVACGQPDDAPGKLKIGYVINFMSHEWYQNISKSATARAAELDVELIVADANLGRGSANLQSRKLARPRGRGAGFVAGGRQGDWGR